MEEKWALLYTEYLEIPCTVVQTEFILFCRGGTKLWHSRKHKVLAILE